MPTKLGEVAQSNVWSIQFYNNDEAKRAMEQLNGFELAGRPIKVSNVTEHANGPLSSGASLDSDELDRAGIDLGASGRLQLMAKLAEGTFLSFSSHLTFIIFQFSKHNGHSVPLKFFKENYWFVLISSIFMTGLD